MSLWFLDSFVQCTLGRLIFVLCFIRLVICFIFLIQLTVDQRNGRRYWCEPPHIRVVRVDRTPLKEKTGWLSKMTNQVMVLFLKWFLQTVDRRTKRGNLVEMGESDLWIHYCKSISQFERDVVYFNTRVHIARCIGQSGWLMSWHVIYRNFKCDAFSIVEMMMK